MSANGLRKQLILISLDWQKNFGISPAITSTVSEFDAALLVGCNSEEYANCMKNRTAVSKGYVLDSERLKNGSVFSGDLFTKDFTAPADGRGVKHIK